MKYIKPSFSHCLPKEKTQKDGANDPGLKSRGPVELSGSELTVVHCHLKSSPSYSHKETIFGSFLTSLALWNVTPFL